MKNFKKFTPVLAGIFLAAFATPSNATSYKKLGQRAIDASRTVEEWNNFGFDKKIPRNLIAAAECVVVIPNIWKVGLGVSARWGAGYTSCRSGNAWSNPTYFKLKGIGFGFQAGVRASDIILVFTRANAVDRLSRGNLTLGADASIAIGPIGRAAEASTDWILRSEIYSYSRSRGAFAGASLEGAVLYPDRSDNRKIYGEYIPVRDQIGIRSPAPGVFHDFVKTLNTHMP